MNKYISLLLVLSIFTIPPLSGDWLTTAVLLGAISHGNESTNKPSEDFKFHAIIDGKTFDNDVVLYASDVDAVMTEKVQGPGCEPRELIDQHKVRMKDGAVYTLIGWDPDQDLIEIKHHMTNKK